MTQTFTVKDWGQKSGNYILKIGITTPLDDMPTIQIYFYPKEAPIPTAVLFNVVQTSYLMDENSIEIINKEPFDGCVVFK
ncbi:hypothetical protein [Chryseobacterium gleum]|uniref:hypothetical protein n=1 Tax=Chryseobacterium gleum TaxID=250 RepID=UPI001E4F50E8|nr:hypothetical protein [Chryseobacterium gleum]MCD9616101.1 hypothetical protein [Chryseobacterium gleum]MCE4064289.1 hypothetical protein [Chryseobacterium gleum]